MHVAPHRPITCGECPACGLVQYAIEEPVCIFCEVELDPWIMEDEQPTRWQAFRRGLANLLNLWGD